MYFALFDARDACNLVIFLVLVFRLFFQECGILSLFFTNHAFDICVIVFIIFSELWLFW